MFFAMTRIPFNEQFAGACARRCVNAIPCRVAAAPQPVMPTFSGYSREEQFTRERCETVEKPRRRKRLHSKSDSGSPAQSTTNSTGIAPYRGLYNKIKSSFQVNSALADWRIAQPGFCLGNLVFCGSPKTRFPRQKPGWQSSYPRTTQRTRSPTLAPLPCIRMPTRKMRPAA